MGNDCPVCNSDNSTIIGKPGDNRISQEFIDKDYHVVQCNKCKTYYISPQISFTDQQWSKLYNSEYFEEQSARLTKRRQKELNERFNNAENLLGRNNSINFLDIGAGEGRALVAGFERQWNVTGVDIVDNRIRKARIDKIKFITGKFIEYDFPENHFDFIYLDSVLEHVLIPLEYLIKIRRILKPGGILYLGVPNEDSLYSDVKRIIFDIIGRKEISAKTKPFDTPYHTVGFNTTSIKFIVKKVGLEIMSQRNFGRKLEFLSRPVNSKGFWIALILLFPIEIIAKILKREFYLEAYLSKMEC